MYLMIECYDTPLRSSFIIITSITPDHLHVENNLHVAFIISD